MENNDIEATGRLTSHKPDTTAPAPDKEHSTDTDKLTDEQIEKNILRKLLGHQLSTDVEGSTPETRKILTNTKPVLRQIKRNEKKVIMSMESETNYDLDILLTDTKYGVDEFTNVIDIEFRELPELKKMTADELADKKRIAELESKLDLEKAVNNMLQNKLDNLEDQLDAVNDSLDSISEIEEQITQTNTVQSAITAGQGRGDTPTGSPQVVRFKLYKQRAESLISKPTQADIDKVKNMLATEVKLALGELAPSVVKTAANKFISPINTLLQNVKGDNFNEKLLDIINEIIKVVEFEETHLASGGRG
jgi:hypothetical protein